MAKSRSGRAELCRLAESLVADYLKRKGFEILQRNARLGRLEIDIIARRRALVVFCEVRSRSRDQWITPAQSIDHRKAEHIRRAAAQWLAAARPGPVEVRLDLASVVFDVPEGRIDYYEAAF
jgi:putative endonuclease